MSDEGQQRLADALQQSLDYHAREYELTYAEIIGVLQLIMFNLMCDACSPDPDEAPEAGEGPDASS